MSKKKEQSKKEAPKNPNIRAKGVDGVEFEVQADTVDSLEQGAVEGLFVIHIGVAQVLAVGSASEFSEAVRAITGKLVPVRDSEESPKLHDGKENTELSEGESATGNGDEKAP